MYVLYNLQAVCPDLSLTIHSMLHISVHIFLSVLIYFLSMQIYIEQHQLASAAAAMCGSADIGYKVPVCVLRQECLCKGPKPERRV